MNYDVIVIGLGGMGSATVCHLAQRGVRVLGLEQFSPAHNRGASHGKTRVTRRAYYEDQAYVPLLLRAQELWHRLERDTGADVLSEVGGLMIGAPDSGVVSGSLRSARQYGLEHEMLDAKDLRRRYPALHPEDHEVALFEREAGFLRPEAAVLAHLDAARKAGADLHFEEIVQDWKLGHGRVTVTTSKGRYEAGRVVICPGPWAPKVLAELALPLVVERQVLYWFDPKGGVGPFLPDRFPIYIWEAEAASTVYGFPAIDGPQGGVKVAYYRAPLEESCTPENIDRSIREAEIQLMRKAIEKRIPALDSRFITGATCMYTNTPDKHFIITQHPGCAEVSIACGFSGHGFKFCSVVGEIMADMATKGTTAHDIRLFSPDRLARA